MAETDPNEKAPTLRESLGMPAVRLAVFVAVAFASLILLIGASIGGSYLLTLHAISQAKTQEAQIRQKADAAANQLRLREEESSVRTAIPTCQALIQMDKAKNGASNASSDPNSYGHRLASAITNVVTKSGCRLLIQKVNAGVPLLTIAREENAAASK